MQFILGVIVGIVIASVGAATIGSYIDRGVSSIHNTVQEVAR